MIRARVFIGSSSAALSIAEHAQSELARIARPELWGNGIFHPNLTPIENLFKALDRFDYALFVAVPEDFTTKRGSEFLTVRDNVLLEAGLFLGRLGRGRVYIIAPQDTAHNQLHLPTDLTGIFPSFYDTTSDSIQSSISVALHPMKQELRRFNASGPNVIFDSGNGLRRFHLEFKGGQHWDKAGKHPISPIGAGNVELNDEAIELSRLGSEGTYEIELRPQGKGEPTIPRIIGSDRIFDLRFEAKVEGTPHDVRAIFVNYRTHEWIDNHVFRISNNAWSVYARSLKAQPGDDVLVRLDDEIEHSPAGKLFIRNISLKEFTTRLQ